MLCLLQESILEKGLNHAMIQVIAHIIQEVVIVLICFVVVSLSFSLRNAKYKRFWNY